MTENKPDGVEPVAQHQPRWPRWLVLLTLGYGMLLFFWLTPEENSLEIVTGLGVGLSLLFWAHLALRIAPAIAPAITPAIAPAADILMPLGLGALAGAIAPIATAGLMFLKTAIHAHPVPDFPPTLMLTTLAFLPDSAVLGAWLGLLVSLVRVLRTYLSQLPEQR